MVAYGAVGELVQVDGEVAAEGAAGLEELGELRRVARVGSSVVPVAVGEVDVVGGTACYARGRVESVEEG